MLRPGFSGKDSVLFRQKIQIRFAKRGELRFISHHDLMRVFERACRRAGLPLRMSEGFNPRPRLSFPLSLAVGVEGLQEVAEVQFTDWVPPTEVERRLQATWPKGLEVRSATAVDPRRTAQAVEATYLIAHPALGGVTAGDLERLMGQRELNVTRWRKGRTGSVDIRPFLRQVTLLPGGAGEPPVPALRVVVRVTPAGTARPEEVLTLLGLHPEGIGDHHERPAGAPATGLSAAACIVREYVRLAE